MNLFVHRSYLRKKLMITALGISHKTAPVAVREKLAFSSDQISDVLQQAHDYGHSDELVVLSTCNRTEFYTISENTGPLVDWWQRAVDLPIKPYLYQHHQTKAVEHLMSVASGLDSMVMGEPQILSQLKRAYSMASGNGSLGKCLQRLFQTSFMVAKKVRTHTGISQNPVSIAYAGVKLASQIFSDLPSRKVLLIGAGQTMQLVGQHLRAQGIKDETFANRSLAKAQALADTLSAKAIGLESIGDCLTDYDIVFSAVDVSSPILTRAIVDKALSKGKRKPMFMVDLGIPRNIESQVGEHDDVFLYNLDDLQQVVLANQEFRQQQATVAQSMIVEQAQQFMGWVESQQHHAHLIQARRSAQSMKLELTQKAMNELRGGKPAEEVVEALAHRLTQKMLHKPTLRVKEAAFDGDETVVKALTDLFMIESS